MWCSFLYYVLWCHVNNLYDFFFVILHYANHTPHVVDADFHPIIINFNKKLSLKILFKELWFNNILTSWDLLFIDIKTSCCDVRLSCSFYQSDFHISKWRLLPAIHLNHLHWHCNHVTIYQFLIEYELWNQNEIRLPIMFLSVVSLLFTVYLMQNYLETLPYLSSL